MRLTGDERRRIDERVKAAEARTGAQIVTAVTPKSDHYPEIPWKAFALGASLGALGRVVSAVLWPRWIDTYSIIADAIGILGAGALLALLTLRVDSIGRLFLHNVRAQVETLQHAEEMFLRRELFATRARNGVLILVSVYEREVVILPDTGLARLLARRGLVGVIDAMVPLLRAGKVCDALCLGVDEVGRLMGDAGPARDAADAGLPDAVIEESELTDADSRDANDATRS